MFYNFFLSIDSLKDNKLRTILSILGIAIGISSVVIVISISSIGRTVVFSELETFGLRSIWVFRDYSKANPFIAIREGTGINNYDFDLIKSNCCTSILYMSPVVVNDNLGTIYKNNNYSSASVLGVNGVYHLIENSEIESGRFINDSDIDKHRSVAVLGSDAAKEIFGKSFSYLGKYFFIGQKRIYVIGVLKKKHRALLSSIGSGNNDANNRILLPYSWVQKTKNNKHEIDYLQAKSTSLDSVRFSINSIISILKRRHRNRYDYKSDNMASYVNTANNILSVISSIGIFAAGVSLLVGGFGIMNIMSSTVVERTREIGLRKAVGASSRNIKNQFLIESLIISTIGGVIGISIGLSISYLVSYYLNIVFPLPFTVAILSLLVTAIVGVLSGYIPAIDASRKKPIDALRHE